MNRLTIATQCAATAAAVILWAGSPLAFIPRVHQDITDVALRDTTLTRIIDGHTLRFSRGAIREIIKANVDQDSGALIQCATFNPPAPPFADSANHFDGERLDTSSQRVMDRLNEANKALRRSPPQGTDARRYLGQVLHAVQDYYAHSNWVETQPGMDTRLGTSSFCCGPASDCNLPTATEHRNLRPISGLHLRLLVRLRRQR